MLFLLIASCPFWMAGMAYQRGPSDTLGRRKVYVRASIALRGRRAAMFFPLVDTGHVAVIAMAMIVLGVRAGLLRRTAVRAVRRAVPRRTSATAVRRSATSSAPSSAAASPRSSRPRCTPAFDTSTAITVYFVAIALVSLASILAPAGTRPPDRPAGSGLTCRPTTSPASTPHRTFGSSTEQPCPVVVVGAGPVGMAAALGLAQRGIPVTILEAADQVSFGSRAICVSRHSLEVADRLGFGAELETDRAAVGRRTQLLPRPEVLHFTMPQRRRTTCGRPMVNVSQSEFEQIMVDALEANPLITLHWQAGIAGFAQDADGVTLDIDTAARPRHLRAALGRRHRRRPQPDARARRPDAAGHQLRRPLRHRRHPLATPTCPPSGWCGSIRRATRARRSSCTSSPMTSGASTTSSTRREDAEVETQEDRIRERISRHLAWLQNDLPWTLEWTGFYRARALALPDFTHDRVLFAGDAAHLVPIFGVRGLNSGMEDAETLAWMLAAVVNGAADSALLKSVLDPSGTPRGSRTSPTQASPR